MRGQRKADLRRIAVEPTAGEWQATLGGRSVWARQIGPEPLAIRNHVIVAAAVFGDDEVQQETEQRLANAAVMAASKDLFKVVESVLAKGALTPTILRRAREAYRKATHVDANTLL